MPDDFDAALSDLNRHLRKTGQANVPELRGRGPGESRDPAAYARSGAGELEGRIAEGVMPMRPEGLAAGAYEAGRAFGDLATGGNAMALPAGAIMGMVPAFRAARGKVPVTPGVVGGAAAGGAALGQLAGGTWREPFSKEGFQNAMLGTVGGVGSTMFSGAGARLAGGQPNAMRTPPAPIPERYPGPPRVYRKPSGSLPEPAPRDAAADFYSDLYRETLPQRKTFPAHVKNITREEAAPGVPRYRGSDGRYVSHERGKTAERLGISKTPKEPQ